MEGEKVFSSSEVALHTSKNDCWLIIQGKVYNVTKFLDEHPGGEEVIIQASGNGDATEAFEEIGHSSTATAMMSSYLIGVLGDDVGGYQKGKVGEEQEGDFVPASTLQGKKPSPTASGGFLDLLLPLLIVALAVGAWYFYKQGKLSPA
ncbi:hypothetical protein ACLOJK_009364 [Asimina triloba]